MKNLVLLGGAHIHAPGFIGTVQKRSDVAFTHVWDPDPACAARRAEQSGAKVVDSLEDAVGVAADAFVVCSETVWHSEIVPMAVPCGKPLFVEKPLGMATRDGNEMADLIEKSGCAFSTGYFMRGDSKVRQLRRWVQDGALGKITRVRASNCHSGALGGWFDTEWRWMADLDQAGVGAFGDLGTHALDLLIWLFGPIESVAALLDVGTARYPDCDETGEALMRFESGVIGTLAAAWDDVDNPVPFMVSGTEGHAAIVGGQLIVKSEGIPGADGKTPMAGLVPGAAAGFDGFLDFLVGKEGAELVDVREAAYRCQVMDAIYQAARAGAWKRVADA